MDSFNDTQSTSVLWARLFKSPSIEGFLVQNASSVGLPPFTDYLASLCRARGEAAERVIKRASIERSYGHSIFRGDRRPSRDTVLQLAFGFEADVEQAQTLLRHAGHSLLYPRVPRDVAIGYCLSRHMSFVDAQNVLNELDMPLIGGA